MNDGFLNIALPKGRLGEKVYAMLEEAGFECPAVLENSRKLIFENAEKRVRYFWVKPSDVAIYVERGAADLGVCGKDILLEYKPDVYELLDLKTGICRMAVAAPNGYVDRTDKVLRVATKFVHIASEFYRKKGRQIHSRPAPVPLSSCFTAMPEKRKNICPAPPMQDRTGTPRRQSGNT